MSDIPFATNLLPSYQSPQTMLQAGANLASTQAGTQQTLAQTGLLGVQTAGADIQNQSNALSLSALQQAMSGGGAPGGAAPSGGSPPTPIGSTGVGGDDVTQSAIDKYAPLPTARPPGVLNQMYAFSRAGKPEIAAAIGAQYDNQVQGANQQRQLAANQSYQTAENIESSDPGTAWETLNRYNPQAAAGLKQKYADATPEELDQDVRTFAQHIGIATHQYTGRPTDFQNGVLVDKNNGKPVLGSSQVLTGLEGGAKAQAFKDANELVTVNNSDGSTSQVPRYKVAGFTSPEGYFIAADKAARSSAASPADSSASQGPPTPTSKAPITAIAPKQNSAPVSPASVTADPVLKSALADPDYKIKTPPIVSGRTPTPAELEQAKTTVAARTELLSNAQDATNTGGQALQYLNAAKAVMDGKGAPVTGPLGALVAKASSVFGGVDATNYQILAKNLLNSAIQSGHGNFGKGMTEGDVSLQKDELSPSVHMTDAALNELVGTGIKNTQYGMDSAKRVRAYLATGGDPQSFAQWNDKHFSRSDAVNQPSPAKTDATTTTTTAGAATEGAKSISKSGKPIVFSNGHWQYAN